MEAEEMRRVIGHRIREARDAKGMKQAELGEALGGISIGSVSGWERGVSSPEHQNLYMVAKVLDVSIEWLYGIDRTDEGYTKDETRLIRLYRQADEHGRKDIYDTAVDAALEKN